MRAYRPLRVLIAVAVYALAGPPVIGQNAVKYEYDAAGRLKASTYLDGNQTQYGLDAAGNRVNVSTGANTTAPSPPTGLTGVGVTSNLVNLNWMTADDVGFLAGYKILRGGQILATVLGSPPALPPTSYSDTSTTCNVTYTYTVEAYDTANPPNISQPSSSIPVLPPTTIPPNVPAGLNQVSISATVVNLAWAIPTDPCGSAVAGYDIYRNGAQIGTSPTNAYQDSTVAGATSYTYTVAAFDSVTPTPNTSKPSGGLPVTTFPAAPTSASATAIEPNYVTVTWAGVTGSALTGYKIYRNNTLLTTIPAGVTTYNDTSTSGTTSYTYAVSAYDIAGESGQTAAPSITTPFLYQITNGGGAVLAPLASLYTSVGPVPATCPGGGVGPCQFFVYEAYGTKSAVRTSVNSIAENSCPYGDGLAPGYTAGTGAFGASNGCLATYVTPAALGQPVDSTTPTGLAATATSATSVSLSWTGSTDEGGPGLGGYYIYRNGARIAQTTGTGTTYTDLTATCNQTYSYSVASYDTASPPDVSGQSSAVPATTPIGNNPPNVPTGLGTSSVAPTQVVLTWGAYSDPCGVPLGGYHVYRNGVAIANSSTNSYTDGGVVGATTYSYSVSAFDSSSAQNTSAQSSALPVTTPAQPYQITDGTGHVISAATSLYTTAIVPASCGPGTVGGPCNFIVNQRYGGALLVRNDTSSAGPNGPWGNIFIAQGYSIGSGANNMATYASAATYGTDLPPPTPTGLSGSAASPTQVNLSWTGVTDGNGALAGYRIYRNGAQIGTSAGTTYSDTSAAASTTYTYTVAAYDTLNIVGAQSSGVSVTTPAAIIQITDLNGHSLSSLYSTKIVPAVCGSGTGNGPCTYVVQVVSSGKIVREDFANSTSGPWGNSTLLSGYSIGTGSNALVTYATSAVYGQP